MELLKKINEDFMSAYKAKNMDKKNYLGFLKSEVTKESKTPDDAYIVGKFKAMVKNGAETNSLNELELEILNGYIPSQMNKDALTDVIGGFIVVNNVTGPQHMGLIMKYLKENHAGEYDGKMASEITRELLNN